MNILEKLAICLDIEEGDILLGGRFKNKRMEVKKIGTDELGQPTVNGQKLLAVRIEKELPEDKMSSKTKEEMKKESSMNTLEKIAQEAFEDELRKIAGKDVPGQRDGTGPYKGSWQKKMFKKGKRQMAGEKCPVKK